jgi:hypothetical protein
MLGVFLVGSVGIVLAANGKQTSPKFAGKKVNQGMVTHEHVDGRHVLTLSGDFKVPDAPDPHWQIVDSKGNTYLLQRLMVKGLVGDRLNESITVPAYVYDVAKVQIWCAYAEVVLGETEFNPPIR